MAVELLSCSVCPKQPSFSDISHLLTHVSSKGHLSHLHELQVRSHQEIAAGVQLAAYNQWYQQHGLGQLLSERMLRKEAKLARRKAAEPGKGPTVKQEHTLLDTLLKRSSPLESRKKPARAKKCTPRKTGRRTHRGVDDENETDLDYNSNSTAVKRPR